MYKHTQCWYLMLYTYQYHHQRCFYPKGYLHYQCYVFQAENKRQISSKYSIERVDHQDETSAESSVANRLV